MYVAELQGRVSLLGLDGTLLAPWGDPGKTNTGNWYVCSGT
jgi:hypothetical protein